MDADKKKGASNRLPIVAIISILLAIISIIALAIVIKKYQDSVAMCEKEDVTCPTLICPDDQKKAAPKEFLAKIDGARAVNLMSSEICSSSTCVKTALKILGNAKKTVDPCQNFYEYACGGWIENNPTSDVEEYISVFEHMDDNLEQELIELMAKPPPKDAPKFLKMLHEEYETCLDLGTDEAMGYDHLKSLIQNLGGWPIIAGKKWNGQSFNVIHTMISIVKMGLGRDFLTSIKVAPHPFNGSWNIITLNLPTFINEDKLFYLEEDKIHSQKQYIEHVKEYAKILEFDINETAIDTQMTEVFNFESALIEYVPDDQSEPKSNFYTLKTLNELTPQINWTNYFRKLVNSKIDENEQINVPYPAYVKKLAEAISNTDKRIIANYLLWRVIERSVPMLNKDSQTWDDCTFDLYNSMQIAISAALIRARAPESNIKYSVSQIAEYIRGSLLSSIPKAKWMSEGTKKLAIEKVRNTNVFAAFVPELLDDVKLDHYYEDLIFSRQSYFMNVINIQKWETNLEFSKLRKEHDETDWTLHAKIAKTTTWFNQLKNSLEIPLGMLEDPVFYKNGFNYLNFGALGFAIGNAFIRGLIYDGMERDEKGVFKKWYDIESDNLFGKLEKCMIDKYNNFTFVKNSFSKTLDGWNTRIENFADTVGIQLAYDAYLHWVQNNSVEDVLPGFLSITPNQLFWTSAANIWCSNYNPKKIDVYLKNVTHSPGMFRVLGPFSNSEDFSKDFNCLSESTMNPKKKCKIW